MELWTPPEARLEDTIAKEADWARRSFHYLKPLFGSLPSDEGISRKVTSAMDSGGLTS